MEQKIKGKVVVVSGGFDPVHAGHVRMFKAAKELVGASGKLIVVLNSDAWLLRKKGGYFMNQDERSEIVYSFECVDEVYIHESDDVHISAALMIIKPDIFANGGDRKADNIPEYKLCEELGIEMVFNVGGDKIQSSSELLKRYASNER